MTFVGFVVDCTGIWWLYKLQNTDYDEYWEYEALLVPPEPPLDVILWMIDEGKKDELDESDKVILRVICWEDNTMFILPISIIGLISGDKPILLLEAWESKDMKERPKLKNQGYCWFMWCLCLASNCSWALISHSITTKYWLRSARVLAVSKMVLNRFKAMLVWCLHRVRPRVQCYNSAPTKP